MRGARILGIDPGSNVAGYGCLEIQVDRPNRPQDFRIHAAGALRFDASLPHPQRIMQLHAATTELLDEFEPQFCVIEKAFFGVNVSSAIKLGEARGAFMGAVARAKKPTKFVEITPAAVKKAVAGNGRASKEKVDQMIKLLLQFERGALPYDVSDALAIALTFGLSTIGVGASKSPYAIP